MLPRNIAGLEESTLQVAASFGQEIERISAGGGTQGGFQNSHIHESLSRVRTFSADEGGWTGRNGRGRRECRSSDDISNWIRSESFLIGLAVGLRDSRRRGNDGGCRVSS